MRELKFRTYDFVMQRYDDAPEMYATTDGHLEPSGNKIIEQYTGLKDKNGKEIYEGDIIATVYKTKCRTDEDIFGEGHDEWDEKIKGKFEVKYSKRATFGISHVKDPVVIRDLWELGRDIKVIGNIHESKELLEV